jgi:hypothetical protein
MGLINLLQGLVGLRYSISRLNFLVLITLQPIWKIQHVKKLITDARWPVEIYHREIKQICGIERCQARHRPSAHST